LRRQLRKDPTLLPGFVQEVMRFDPPVQNTRRFVAKDCRIQGHDLRQGEAILVLLAPTSRDPAVYDEPHRFRLDRAQQLPIGFGHGRHACAGPAIATAIAAAGIQYWVNHDLALPAPLGYRPSVNARIPRFSQQRSRHKSLP
jgi:cytochrome P450